MRLWSLTLGVGLAHLAVLWGAAQWGERGTDLVAWDDPQFTQQVGLDHRPRVAPPLLAANDGAAVPLSTVGQALQVRTVSDWPPVEVVATSAPAQPVSSPPVARAPKTPPPSTNHTRTITEAAPSIPSDTTTTLPTEESPRSVESEPVAISLAAAHAPSETSVPSVDTALVPTPTPMAAPASDPQEQAPAAAKKDAAPADEAVDLAAAVAHWPPATRLNYKLHGHYKGDLYGNASVQWQRQGTRYQVQVNVNVSLLFHLRMTSQGRVTPQALWPETYQEERRGKMRGASMGDAVVRLDNGQTVPRPKLLQDTASQFVQLAQDFAHQRRPLRVGTVVSVPLARPGGVDEWVYDVVAIDTLTTPLGQVPAFHLQPRPLAKARSGVDVDMWFAPSLQHLPVRIRLNLGPEVWLDLLLESIDQTAAPTATS